MISLVAIIFLSLSLLIKLLNMILLVLIGRSFSQDVIQDSFGFWVDSFFDDACDSCRLREVVWFSIKWRSFKLLEAWYRLLKLLFERTASRVNWVDRDVKVVKLLQSFTKIVDIVPVSDLVIIYPELL